MNKTKKELMIETIQRFLNELLDVKEHLVDIKVQDVITKGLILHYEKNGSKFYMHLFKVEDVYSFMYKHTIEIINLKEESIFLYDEINFIEKIDVNVSYNDEYLLKLFKCLYKTKLILGEEIKLSPIESSAVEYGIDGIDLSF